jgi:hypothetical protein
LTELITASHPILLVEQMTNRYGGDIALSFSRYYYRPQSPFDEREIFSEMAGAVTADWLQTQFSRLKPEWDLALNSVVRDIRGRNWHIPMIDFAKGSVMASDLLLMRSVLGPKADEYWLYASGRSLHGYGTTLLKPKQWIAFMGKLLLLNLPGKTPLVDSRWVGHRLTSGYAALRWSANSPHYVAMPARTFVSLDSLASVSELGKL